MTWEVGKRYRFRAVPGEFAIKKIETTGTRFVEGLVEVTLGSELGSRIRYQGYVNSERNAKQTADDLRAMGCKMQRWGDWSGLGLVEFTGMVMADEKDGKTYFRVAFCSPLRRTSDKGKVSSDDVADLNEKMPPPPPGPPVELKDDDEIPY